MSYSSNPVVAVLQQHDYAAALKRNSIAVLVAVVYFFLAIVALNYLSYAILKPMYSGSFFHYAGYGYTCTKVKPGDIKYEELYHFLCVSGRTIIAFFHALLNQWMQHLSMNEFFSSHIFGDHLLPVDTYSH